MDDIVHPGADGRPATSEFRRRNDELFARRKELQQSLKVLRAAAEGRGSNAASELAIHRIERELDELTEEMVNMNYGLVRRYVALFTSKSNENREDFESAGKVGLLWAISSYDPARGPFANWAFKPIQREIVRAVRDADHPNLTPGDFEKRPIILAAEREYLEDSGPDARPDFSEIARRAGVSEAQVRRVLEPPRLDSLHTSVRGQDEDESQWADRLVDPALWVEDQVVLRFHLHALVSHGLPSLDSRERYVLMRRFGLDGEPTQSFRAIGERLGLSREGVRQIQHKALAKLNHTIERRIGNRRESKDGIDAQPAIDARPAEACDHTALRADRRSDRRRFR